MNIRRFFRLSCLSVMGFFWASCGSDSDTSTSVTVLDPGTDSEGSSEALPQTSSSAEPSSSEAVPESSSSEIVQSSSSVDSAESGSLGDDRVKLSRDTSVTCTVKYTLGNDCLSSGSSEPSYSCMQLQEFLEKDTTVSQKILDKWEEKLLSCGAIREEATVYGVIYTTCQRATITYLDDCSDGKQYYNIYGHDNGIAYISKAEYDEVHSSSSVAESSSSSAEPEDLVQNCRHVDFFRFVDILADVQQGLFTEIVAKLENGPMYNDAQKEYLEGLLDRGQWTLKDNFAPYFEGNHDADRTRVYESDYWFNGYIAKREECPDGVPEYTQLYLDKYYEILNECRVIIEEKLKSLQ